MGRATLRAMCAALVGVTAVVTVATLAQAQSIDRNFINVRLKWYHQAQFAGFYAAEQKGYFAQQGVNVHILEGSPTQNSLQSIADGSADVAVASLVEAQQATAYGIQFVNVAQLFQGNDDVLLCSVSARRESDWDLSKATIGIRNPEQRAYIQEILAAKFPNGSQPTFVKSMPDIESLVNDDADCIFGSTFNEYPRALSAGLDVFIVDPADVGVALVQDGLYVDANRLKSAKFREDLAHLVVGLKHGWQFATANPESAVRMVLQLNPSLDYGVQTQQLEDVLALIGPVNATSFGYYDISKYAQKNSLGLPVMSGRLESRFWTHSVYVEVQKIEHRNGVLSPAVNYYISSLRSSTWYKGLIEFGTFAAALAGGLVGVRRRYRFWGCYVLALASAMGGGVIRDVLLGGERYPIWLVRNPFDFYLCLVATSIAFGISRWKSRSRGLEIADMVANRADVVGFSILAIHGAAIAMSANHPAIWAPLAAALTVSGGGVVTDVLLGSEHKQYRDVAYEEVAIAGALILLAGLWVADWFEHNPNVVFVWFMVTLALLLTGRYAVLRRSLASRVRYAARKLSAPSEIDEIVLLT